MRTQITHWATFPAVRSEVARRGTEPDARCDGQAHRGLRGDLRRRLSPRPRRPGGHLVRDRGDGPAPELQGLPRARPEPRRPGGGLHRPLRQGDPEVGGEEHELEPGVWARVGPDEKRKLVTGDEPASVLAVGGTPGKVYEPPEFTHEGSSAMPLDGRDGRDEGRGPPQDAALAEQVLAGRAAAEPAAPGPSSSVTRCAEAGDHRSRHAGVLVADQVGRRGQLVGDRDHGRGQLAPAGVARARASRRAAPARRSRSRRRPGPAATAARSCRRSPRRATLPTASRIPARIRARRGVGVLGKQRDPALLGQVRGVDPGVGADPAVVRSR